jgi:PKD repeat protein
MAVFTIGSTNPAGASNGVGTGVTNNSLWLTKRTLSGVPAGAKWTALRAWISGGSSGQTRVWLMIYDDLSNSPNHFVGGSMITVANGAAAAEYTVTLPGTADATNGSYWVGFWIENGAGGPVPWYATSGGTMAYGNPGFNATIAPDPYTESGVNGVNDIRVAADATTAAAVTPVANFTGTPLTGTEPLAVTFTDSSTNTPTSWAWTFGDGGTSTSQNPSHTYTTAGTFTVALTATNASGSNTLTRTGYVTVADQPRPIRINTSQGWRDIADDTSFVSGSGTPTPAVGATGAIYLNTATGLLYGPKAAGAWPGTALPVPGGSSDPRFPSYGTTLPGSPVDGQEAILVDSTSAPTYRWRFRYNAGSSSTFKWEFIGGGAISNYLGTQQAVGSASTWVDLGTGQPIVTVPRAGDYRAEWRFRMLNADPAAQQAFVTVVPAGGTPGTIQAGSTAIAPSQVTDYSDFASPTRDASLAAIAAGITIRLMYYATSTNVSFSNRLLAVTPIRVA